MLSSLGSEVSQAAASGYLPLHLAALNDDVESLDVLIQLGVTLDAKTPDGQTALHLTAERFSSLNVKNRSQV